MRTPFLVLLALAGAAARKPQLARVLNEIDELLDEAEAAGGGRLERAETQIQQVQSTALQTIKLDTKQYDSTPTMIKQAIDAVSGDRNPRGVVFHYCSLAKLKQIEKGGMRIDPQGKGGGGLYFFKEGPDAYDFHGRVRYPSEWNQFVKKLALEGRGELELQKAEKAIDAGGEEARRNQQWFEVCIVCYVNPDLLFPVEGRAGAVYLKKNILEGMKGCEQRDDGHWFVSRSAQGCKIVDILGAIQIIYGSYESQTPPLDASEDAIVRR